MQSLRSLLEMLLDQHALCRCSCWFESLQPWGEGDVVVQSQQAALMICYHNGSMLHRAHMAAQRCSSCK